MDDRTKMRRVAIYGRVSTEHDAQLSAFENQQAWYESEIAKYPDWLVVDRFYDEGITGTAALKRPEFMRMIECARRGDFDLIVTREVCRFARNTVDTLNYTRELKHYGVEVFFMNDGIWTFSSDGELRLSIFATLAQDESRKISERVRSGQKISREKNHTIYGSGNILGYNRENGTYVINEEQARVVRMIYEMYASGLGCKRICNELMILGCKNAGGECVWDISRINRIIRNATYKGFIGYNKSHCTDFLTHKRVNHKQSEYQYIKGDFEPIVSEELWDKCQALREERKMAFQSADGEKVTIPQKYERNVWVKKLRCSCGSAFYRFKWHRRVDGTNIYSFKCARQSRSPSSRYLMLHGLDENVVCSTKTIPFWQMDLMAFHVFRHVFSERREAVLLACNLINECFTMENDSFESSIVADQKLIEKLKRRQNNLRLMRADGDISREDFLNDNLEIQKEIDGIETRIARTKALAESKNSYKLDMGYIEEVLNSWTTFEGPFIPESLIEQFILQVVLIDDNTFNWTLDLSKGAGESATAAEIALEIYREKRRNEIGNKVSHNVDSILTDHILNPKDVLTFDINLKDAEQYCNEIGMKLFRKKWSDKKIIVSI